MDSDSKGTPQPSLQSAGDTTTIPAGALSAAFEVLQEFGGQPLEVGLSARIIRLSRAALPHYQQYIQDRGEVAAQFGEKISEGKYQVSAEKLADYEAALAPHNERPVELNSGLLLTLEEMRGVNITPLALERLEPLLVGLA